MWNVVAKRWNLLCFSLCLSTYIYSLRIAQQSGISVAVIGENGNLGLHVQRSVMEGDKNDHAGFGIQQILDVPSLMTVLLLVRGGNIATAMKFVTMVEHIKTIVDAHPGGKVHVVTKVQCKYSYFVQWYYLFSSIFLEYLTILKSRNMFNHQGGTISVWEFSPNFRFDGQ